MRLRTSRPLLTIAREHVVFPRKIVNVNAADSQNELGEDDTDDTLNTIKCFIEYDNGDQLANRFERLCLTIRNNIEINDNNIVIYLMIYKIRTR